MRYALTETHVIPPGATTKCWVPLVFPLVYNYVYTHRRERQGHGFFACPCISSSILLPSIRPFFFFFQNGRMMMKGERRERKKKKRYTRRKDDCWLVELWLVGLSLPGCRWEMGWEEKQKKNGWFLVYTRLTVHLRVWVCVVGRYRRHCCA